MILCFYTSDRLSPILLCSFGARLIPLYLISSSFSLSLFFSAHGKLLLQLRAWNFRLRNDGCSMQREGTEQRADRTGSFNFNYALSFDVHFLRVLFIVIILFGRLERERERERERRPAHTSTNFSLFFEFLGKASLSQSNPCPPLFSFVVSPLTAAVAFNDFPT